MNCPKHPVRLHEIASETTDDLMSDAQRACGNDECTWEGPASETLDMPHGYPRMLCPRCHDTTESTAPVADAQQASEPIYQWRTPSDRYVDITKQEFDKEDSANKRIVYATPQPALRVWYGPMPESNGKTNWTAILHRGDISEGITVDRSEYPDRVRYEADRMRFMIGEIQDAPDILAYDSDKHSGHVGPAPALIDELVRKAKLFDELVEKREIPSLMVNGVTKRDPVLREKLDVQSRAQMCQPHDFKPYYAGAEICERCKTVRGEAAPAVALTDAPIYKAGVEAAAKMLEKKADDYALEYGSDDMGSLSFGQGSHAQAKLEYHSTLLELAEDVRALAVQPAKD